MAQRPCQKYGSDNYTTALQSWNKTIQTHCEGSLLSSSKSVSLLSSAWFHSLHIKAKRIILVLPLNSHFWTRRPTFLLLNIYNALSQEWHTLLKRGLGEMRGGRVSRGQRQWASISHWQTLLNIQSEKRLNNSCTQAVCVYSCSSNHHNYSGNIQITARKRIASDYFNKKPTLGTSYMTLSWYFISLNFCFFI